MHDGRELRYGDYNPGPWPDYLAKIAETDWLDLANRQQVEQFVMEGKLEAPATYTWGFIEWYQVAKVQASVPLRSNDGSLTGDKVHTKAGALVDHARYKQGIDYFPTVLPREIDMTAGASEEMTVMLEDTNTFSAFELGTPVVVPANNEPSVFVCKDAPLAADNTLSLVSVASLEAGETLQYSKGAGSGIEGLEDGLEYNISSVDILASTVTLAEGPHGAQPGAKSKTDAGYPFNATSQDRLTRTSARETELSYEVDFSYTIDRNALVAFKGIPFKDQKPDRHTCCSRDNETLNCICDGGNVLSLNDNGVQLEVRTPSLLPLVYRTDSEGVVRATYMVEIASSTAGSNDNFMFRPSMPWFIRLDTFYVVPQERVAGTVQLSPADTMFAAYFNLLDYFEITDEGTLYDHGQVARLLSFPAFFPHPILATKLGFHSIFGDFVPFHTVGQWGELSILHTAGGNAGYHCICDLDRQLMRYIFSTPDTFPSDETLVRAKAMLKQTCGFDATNTNAGEQAVDFDEKRVCLSLNPPPIPTARATRPSTNGHQGCCDPTNLDMLRLPPVGLNYWDVYDADKLSIDGHYIWGAYDHSCPRSQAFGLGSCGAPVTKGTDAYTSAVNEGTAGVQLTCDYAATCSHGNLSCTRTNFASAGGGCSPNQAGAWWDLRKPQRYQLVEVAKI